MFVIFLEIVGAWLSKSQQTSFNEHIMGKKNFNASCLSSHGLKVRVVGEQEDPS